MSGVGGDCPAIMPVKPLLRLHPGGTSIPADGDACTRATAFIDPVTTRDMEGERVAIAQRTPAMPAPCLPAITAAYDCSSLNAHHDGPGVRRRERNRLHIGAVWFLSTHSPQPRRAKRTE